jgi:transcriptional regulator with XRE-family HTH domain
MGETFGRWLNAQRLRARMTGEQVARASGINSRTYRRYEQGARLPSMAVAEQLAKVLGVELAVMARRARP